jgi:hypothetical protein
MDVKALLKPVLVAAGSGAIAALSAMILDSHTFNLRNGLGDEAFMALQGAVVGLAAHFVGRATKTEVKPPSK